MTSGNSNSWVYWTIGGVALVGLGVGSYMYYKNKRDQKEQDQKNAENQQTQQTQQTQSQQSPEQTTTALKDTPFTNKQQGNAFRRWVISKHPDYAKEINLDASGNQNNKYIQQAWAKYSQEYYTKNDLSLKALASHFVQSVTKIDGGVVWKSTSAVPRGEVRLYTDGKFAINGVNAENAQTKYQEGGWYSDGTKLTILLGSKTIVANSTTDFSGAMWTALKSGKIFDEALNQYTPFLNMVDSASSNDYQDETL